MSPLQQNSMLMRSSRQVTSACSTRQSEDCTNPAHVSEVVYYRLEHMKRHGACSSKFAAVLAIFSAVACAPPFWKYQTLAV